jgi:hypothetical protein
MLPLAAQSLVTVSVHTVTQRHLLADCWQTTLRAEVEDALCLVEHSVCISYGELSDRGTSAAFAVALRPG